MNKYAHSWMIIDNWMVCTIFIVIGEVFDLVDSKGVLKWVWLSMMIYCVLVGIFRSKLRKSHAPARLRFKGSWSELTEILIFQMNLKLENKIEDYYMFRETHRIISNNYVQVLKTDEGFELITNNWSKWLVKSLLEFDNFEKYYLDQKYKNSKAIR